MSEKRFFTKINKNGRNVIIDKECHIEIIDLTLACEVLNRLDLKLKTYNDQLGEQQDTISQLEKNFDDLVEWASEIAQRNVILDEKIGKIQRENEQLQKQVESSETTSNATSNYNAFLESKITTLEKENRELRKELDNFQPVMFQDVRKGTVILYSKKGDCE